MSETKERKKPVIDIDARWANALSEDIGPVIPQGNGVYFVVSRSKKRSSVSYRVTLRGNHIRKCTCTYGAMRRQSACKHVLAVINYAVAEKGYRAVWPMPAGYDWEADGCDAAFNIGEGFVMPVTRLKREKI